MKTVIGIDLGGTNVRMALVGANGKIQKILKKNVGVRRSPAETILLLTYLIDELMDTPGAKPAAIGLGIPGIVSAPMGTVFSSPHYPEWKNFKIAALLQRKIRKPIFVDNDANCIALGEKWQGAAKDWPHFLALTLGTGIGGGIVINSQIFHGTRGFAGEFGHIVVETEGPPCPCGSKGCLERFASASGLRRIVNHWVLDEDLLGDTELEEVAKSDDLPYALSQLARSGHQSAIEVFNQFGYYLGIGIASLVNATGIENVVLGGGLMGSGDLFLPETKKEIARRTYAETAKGIKIRKAKLGDKAGILGAAKMAFENL